MNLLNPHAEPWYWYYSCCDCDWEAGGDGTEDVVWERWWWCNLERGFAEYSQTDPDAGSGTDLSDRSDLQLTPRLFLPSASCSFPPEPSPRRSFLRYSLFHMALSAAVGFPSITNFRLRQISICSTLGTDRNV
jgi:hypothetical protein